MKREARALGWGEPLKILNFPRSPHSVSGARALRLRHEPDSLIVTDTVWPHAGEMRKVADRQFLRRHAGFPIPSILNLGTVSKVKSFLIRAGSRIKVSASASQV